MHTGNAEFAPIDAGFVGDNNRQRLNFQGIFLLIFFVVNV